MHTCARVYIFQHIENARAQLCDLVAAQPEHSQVWQPVKRAFVQIGNLVAIQYQHLFV